MARLPIVGSDNGTWGAILNDFLGVAHNANGSLKVVYNVQDYGAMLDSTTDDSAAIQAAIDAAAATGGGIVLIPGHDLGAGTRVKINSPLNMKQGVWLRGLGPATSLIGTADPMIQIGAINGVDRMTISDLFLQTPIGVGIHLTVNGAYQLGWPRITVENITIADAGGNAFSCSFGILEARFINCVTLRSMGLGFYIEGTDCMFYGCTAGESALHGYNVGGGNNKLAICKAYGGDQDGFRLVGGGRQVLAGCSSQDNTNYGVYCESDHNVVSGFLGDTDGIASVGISGHDNYVSGSFMHGGGGTAQQTKAGVFFSALATGNIVQGTTNNLTPVAGKAEANTAYINSAPGSRKEIAFTATWTPNPYDAEIQAMTLTGGLTLVNPVYKHVGQRLTLELRQDSVGGRTVTFPSEFRTNWTPVTTANNLNVITFEYDGTAWQQTSSTVGITPKPSIGKGDTFNRANEALNVSSTGHTWEKFNSGGGSWQVVSNQGKTSGASPFTASIAVLDAGVPDCTVEVTLANKVYGSGVVWRYTDSNNYMAFAEVYVKKVVAGVPTTFQSGVWSLVTGDVVKVITSGPNHFLYKNGTLIYTFSDTFNLTATKAGIYSFGDDDIFDNFTIT